MIKIIPFLIIGFSCIGCTHAQSIKVITYNIRYDNPNDGENWWEVRKEYLAKQVKFHEPDIMGIQEGLSRQVNYLDSSLVSYSYVGVGRDDGKTKGEYSAIFYKTEKFEVVDQSTFWLSKTPSKPTVGWDASMERICTYALLKEIQTGKSLWVFNTHFDHIGQVARDSSARLIVKKIRNLNAVNYPVVVMGDLNLEPSSKTIKYLSGEFNDARYESEGVVFGPEGTYNGFNFSQPVTRRIDYIFTDKEKIKVNKYAVLSDSKDLKYPSDHLPVFVEISLIAQ